MSYELYNQNPSAFFSVVLISLGITVLAYCAFPLIFAALRKSQITGRKYRVLCYCVNFAVMAGFIAINGKASGAPYALWTWIFSVVGIKILKKKYLIIDGQPQDISEPVADTAPITDGPVVQQEPLTQIENDLSSSENSNSNPSSIVPEIEPEINESDPAPEITRTPDSGSADLGKSRYCKYCGGLIDAETKKCTSCGKQYFKFPKRIIGRLALGIIFAVLIGLNVYQYVTDKAIINDLNETIEIKNLTIDNLTNKNKTLNAEKAVANRENNYYESHAAIVLKNGTKVYHIYGCKEIDGSSEWIYKAKGESPYLIYDVETAERYGYTPCPKCEHSSAGSILGYYLQKQTNE